MTAVSRSAGRARSGRTGRGVAVALLTLTLAPALVLTVLRLLQPDAGWTIRGIAFTPYAAPLYTVGLVVLLLATVRSARAHDGRTSARRLLAAVLTATLLFLHLSWLAPAWTGDVPEAADGGPRLRVLSANVLQGATPVSEVAALADQADADVVVLQEVTDSWWREARQGELARSHPYTAGVPSGAVAPGTVVMARRPVGRAEPLGTAGDTFLVRVRLGERTITMLAAHPRYPVRREAWLADHALLAQTVKERRPQVMAGDFNATADHEQLRRYLDLGYRTADELLNTGWSPTWPDHGRQQLWGIGLPRLVQLDHVLVGRGFAATEVEHLDLPASDHRAVVAEVGPR